MKPATTQRRNVVIARPHWQAGRAMTLSSLATEHVSDIAALRRVIRSRRPAFVILVLDMPGVHGVADLHDLQQLSPTTRIVVVSSAPTSTEEMAALRAGARGYSSETTAWRLMPSILQKVGEGEIWASRRTIAALLDEARGRRGVINSSAWDETLDRLTSRQRQIVRMLRNGAKNKEIALALDVTVGTVKSHLTRIFRKLDQPDRVHVALLVADTRD